MILASPLARPTNCQTFLINPILAYMLNFFGFSVHYALLVARTLPVAKHTVYKRASFFRPVVDDSFCKKYKLTKKLFSNIHQSVDETADPPKPEIKTSEEPTPSAPMFDNPMPLYVTYDQALQYETPSAPPFPYLMMEDDAYLNPPSAPMQQPLLS